MTDETITQQNKLEDELQKIREDRAREDRIDRMRQNIATETAREMGDE